MVALQNSPQTDNSRYKQMWTHERNRRIEVEQENYQLRKMIKVIFQSKLDYMSDSVISQIGRWQKW